MELMHSLVDTTPGALQVCCLCLLGLGTGVCITEHAKHASIAGDETLQLAELTPC